MAYQYKKVRVAKNKTRDQHRIIMEQILGRDLKSWEVVHHMDGNKRNNDIKNLVVMCLSEHSSMHMKGRNFSDKTKEKLRISGRENRTACKLSIQDVKDIRKYISEGSSVTVISRKYKVSRKGIYNVINRKTWYWVD